MHKLLLTAAMLVTLALTGCVTTPQQDQTVASTVEYGCAAAATALDVVRVAETAGHIDAATHQKVATLAAEINPVCSADAPPTMDDLKMQAFARAVTALQLLAAKH